MSNKSLKNSLDEIQAGVELTWNKCSHAHGLLIYTFLKSLEIELDRISKVSTPDDDCSFSPVDVSKIRQHVAQLCEEIIRLQNGE